jgi:hypothetical protein
MSLTQTELQTNAVVRVPCYHQCRSQSWTSYLHSVTVLSAVILLGGCIGKLQVPQDVLWSSVSLPLLFTASSSPQNSSFAIESVLQVQTTPTPENLTRTSTAILVEDAFSENFPDHGVDDDISLDDFDLSWGRLENYELQILLGKYPSLASIRIR